MFKLLLRVIFFVFFSANTLFTAGYAKPIIIDARYDLEAAIELYRNEITDAEKRSINKRFIILVNGKRGFDVGYLRLPNRTMKVDIKAKIYVYRGDVKKPIRINLFKLNRRRVVAKLNTLIRG